MGFPGSRPPDFSSTMFWKLRGTGSSDMLNSQSINRKRLYSSYRHTLTPARWGQSFPELWIKPITRSRMSRLPWKIKRFPATFSPQNILISILKGANPMSNKTPKPHSPSSPLLLSLSLIKQKRCYINYVFF